MPEVDYQQALRGEAGAAGAQEFGGGLLGVHGIGPVEVGKGQVAGFAHAGQVGTGVGDAHAQPGVVGQGEVVPRYRHDPGDPASLSDDRIIAIGEDLAGLIEEFVTRDAHSELLDGGYDMVVDCIDSYRDKAAIIAWCRRSKVPVVTVGGTGGKRDPGAFAIRDLSRTEKDPLLSRVRKELRQQYDFPRNPKRRFSVPAVFSLEQVSPAPANAEVCVGGSPGRASRLQCGGLGSVTHVTATAGFYAVSKVLEKLSSTPESALC